MPILCQKCIAVGVLALRVAAAGALTVGPTLGQPPAARGSDLGRGVLDDCLGLVQVGSPRRARAFAPPAAALEEPEAPQQQQPQPLAAASAYVAAAAPAEAKHLAGLSLALGLLFAALRFRVSRLRAQGQAEEGPAPPAAVKAAEAAAEQEPEAERHDPPTELAEMPPPMRRLRYIGASYVVPRDRIERCVSETLTFDVPTLPCVWPLRALLSRPSPAAPWSRLQLTVDIIAASGLPPLLTCTRAGALARPEESGGTGGTGSPTGDEPPASLNLDAWDEAQTEDDQEAEEGEAYPWLKISNAGGTVVATIRRRRDGSCVVQRQDRSTLDMAMHLDGAVPWITLSKQGQEISQATSLGCGREEHLQIDTQPDVQSPESCVLLMCTIAALAFRQ